MSGQKLIAEVMRSVMIRTRAYFASEFGINITENGSCMGEIETITLLDMTAIISIGGAINLLIAFSFQETLLNVIYDEMTDGLGIPFNEIDRYRKAAAGDVINTVLGHCTIDLQKLDRNGVVITPPIIIRDIKKIRHLKNAMFYTQNLNTPLGGITISVVGQKELFGTNFNQ